MSLPARHFAKDPHALEELLRSGLVHKPRLEAPSKVLRTGVVALDAALGGGILRGHLHEFVAPAGAGGTTLLRATIAAATQAGELCALIDPADAFDPAHAGIDLRRLLWVRPRDPLHALRAAEIALEARFALVALDLGDAFAQVRRAQPGEVRVVRFDEKRAGFGRFGKKRTGLGSSPWARLARCAEKHGGALVVLAREAQAGTFAVATVELEHGSVVWEGGPGAPGRFLRGTSAICAVARHKRTAPSGPIALPLPVCE